MSGCIPSAEGSEERVRVFWGAPAISRHPQGPSCPAKGGVGSPNALTGLHHCWTTAAAVVLLELPKVPLWHIPHRQDTVMAQVSIPTFTSALHFALLLPVLWGHPSLLHAKNHVPFL